MRSEHQAAEPRGENALSEQPQVSSNSFQSCSTDSRRARGEGLLQPIVGRRIRPTLPCGDRRAGGLSVLHPVRGTGLAASALWSKVAEVIRPERVAVAGSVPPVALLDVAHADDLLSLGPRAGRGWGAK